MFTPHSSNMVTPCLLGFVCIQIIMIIINIIIVLLTTETGQAGRITDDPERLKGWGEVSGSPKILLFGFLFLLYLKLEFANLLMNFHAITALVASA